MIYVFLANGFEEIEGLTVVDFLRRAELEVCTVGVGGKLITGAHNIPVFCDLEESEVRLDDELKAVVLPGGMPGTLNLEKCETVKSAVSYCAENDRFVCAICAAPSVLGHMGLLRGRKACCFPGFENELDCKEYTGAHTETDGFVVTAKGAGCAVEFGHAIACLAASKAIADNVIGDMQCL